MLVQCCMHTTASASLVQRSCATAQAPTAVCDASYTILSVMQVLSYALRVILLLWPVCGHFRFSGLAVGRVCADLRARVPPIIALFRRVLHDVGTGDAAPFLFSILLGAWREARRPVGRMPSQKSLRTKLKLAKKAKQNRCAREAPPGGRRWRRLAAASSTAH